MMRTYNIVDGNVNQLYKIANKAHNHEPGANSAACLLYTSDAADE